VLHGGQAATRADRPPNPARECALALGGRSGGTDATPTLTSRPMYKTNFKCFAPAVSK
jgi:hypothetical protein